MRRNSATAIFTLGSILVLGGALLARQIGEAPAIANHMNEADIESGRVPFPQVVQYGERLFSAFFNRLDGQGQPGTTSDSHSCSACHSQPRMGGGGDFATNVAGNERITI